MDQFNDDQRQFLAKSIGDVKERFVHEMDKALLNRDLYLAVGAMCGRDACDRIARELALVEQMGRNAVLVRQLHQRSLETKRLMRARLRLANRERKQA